MAKINGINTEFFAGKLTLSEQLAHMTEELMEEAGLPTKLNLKEPASPTKTQNPDQKKDGTVI